MLLYYSTDNYYFNSMKTNSGANEMAERVAHPHSILVGRGIRVWNKSGFDILGIESYS